MARDLCVRMYGGCKNFLNLHSENEPARNEQKYTSKGRSHQLENRESNPRVTLQINEASRIANSVAALALPSRTMANKYTFYHRWRGRRLIHSNLARLKTRVNIAIVGKFT